MPTPDDANEKKLIRIQKSNDKILAAWKRDLESKNKYSKKRCAEYADCLRFFASHYLPRYDPQHLIEGLHEFDSFASDWFIRNCMWSDENSVKLNFAAFYAFLQYLEETKKIPFQELEELRAKQPEKLDRALLRVKYYNDRNVDVEEIMDDNGDWDDDYLRSLEPSRVVVAVENSAEPLSIHLLVSARAAKFLNLTPPQLVSMKTWGKSWNDPQTHWLAEWRCEECFPMKGTKERIFIISNEKSRYSFLMRIAPGDIIGLFEKFYQRLKELLCKNGCKNRPPTNILVTTLSGFARSLTSFQNEQLFMIDTIIDCQNYKYLEDIEDKLNQTLSTIDKKYQQMDEVFRRLCDEDPPFTNDDSLPDNVIPFPN